MVLFMELKFKPQSTFYTCVQATQAIALNSFINTEYSDLDDINSLTSYSTDEGILMFGAHRKGFRFG